MADVYYGSDVADGTLTLACDMAKNSTGGVEATKTTTVTGANDIYEITSQGLTVASVTSIPATPTGKGWCFKFTQNGTLQAGNYSAVCNLSAADWGIGSTTTIVRFFYLPGGVLANKVLLASLTAVTMTSLSKTQYSWTNVAGAQQAINAGDYLYIDGWANDSMGSASDNPTVFESSSAVNGVVNDVQFTAPSFIPTITNIPLMQTIPSQGIGYVTGAVY